MLMLLQFFVVYADVGDVDYGDDNVATDVYVVVNVGEGNVFHRC